jgi:hypothetical protein
MPAIPRALLIQQGRGEEGPRPAHPHLRLVYRGFKTVDLKEAKALLEELGSTGARTASVQD